MLSSAFDLVLVILGFSLIIVVHELGHFVAARWAGIRVLAFAVGFGPAICSYRKGMGFRAGSSEGAFRALVKEGRTAEVGGPISPTEYRLNVLPLGGYVKMLGQDDSDPTATSDAADSYQKCSPPKRMVVISAGVIMNLLLAAVLFCIVFLMGLKTEPARVGQIVAGSPAARAAPLFDETDPSAVTLGPGLRPGDEIISIDGERMDTFQDVTVKVVMAKGGSDLDFVVRRENVGENLTFRLSPQESKETRTLEVGIGPMISTQLSGPGPRATAEVVERFDSLLARFGVPTLRPGDRLIEVNGRPVSNVYALREAAAEGKGAPIAAVFERADGSRTEVRIDAVPTMQESVARLADDRLVALRHLLGLLPVLSVADTDQAGKAAGLQAGDVFARLGDLEYPSIFAGITAIRSRAGKSIEVVVLREVDGAWREVDLGSVKVSRRGTVGFEPTDTALRGSWVTVWPKLTEEDGPAPVAPLMTDAAGGGWLPGTRIVRVNNEPVDSLAAVREALRLALGPTASGSDDVTIRIGFVPPVARRDVRSTPAAEDAMITYREFRLDSKSREALAELTWDPLLPVGMFEPERIVLRESNPLAGIRRGVERTHNVMMMTYLTFLRLFEGTVKVEHLKGPVGIAHIGTLLAGKGLDWLLFFLALISVNLAVINFLPIPITDGGHFLFLLYEQLTGKPPPVVVQNAAALIGFVLLGGVFLFVLVNDIMNLAR